MQTLSCALWSPAFAHEDVIDLLSPALTEHWKYGDCITAWSVREEAYVSLSRFSAAYPFDHYESRLRTRRFEAVPIECMEDGTDVVPDAECRRDSTSLSFSAIRFAVY